MTVSFLISKGDILSSILGRERSVYMCYIAVACMHYTTLSRCDVVDADSKNISQSPIA